MAKRSVALTEEQLAEADSMNPFTDNGRDYRPRVKVDQVNHPPHYQLPGIEAIAITKHLNFCSGNVVKYIVRAGRKDPDKHLEDLEKAAFYLAAEIDRVRELVGKS